MWLFNFIVFVITLTGVCMIIYISIESIKNDLMRVREIKKKIRNKRL
jgi:hypothetical protein